VLNEFPSSNKKKSIMDEKQNVVDDDNDIDDGDINAS